MVRSRPKPRRSCKMFGVTRFPPPTPDQPKPRPMSQFRPLPPIQELQQAFDYDPVTGIFRNKYTRCSRAVQGAIAGKVKQDGYLCLTFKRRQLTATRVAWYLMTGFDPLNRQVDHKDRDRTNNAFHNLRLATPSQNSVNRLQPGWWRKPPKQLHEHVAKHIEIHGEFSPYCATVTESTT